MIGKESLAGMVLDLSEGGCRWVYNGETMPPLKIDESVQMIFQLPGEGGGISCTTIVRNIICESGQMRIGFSFSNLEPESLKKIRRYVTEAQQFQQGMG